MIADDGSGRGLVVVVDDRTPTVDRAAGDGADPGAGWWRSVAVETLVAEGVAGGRLDLLLVGVDEMAALNRQHLGGDGPTDVLAFPLDGPEVAARTGSGGEAAEHRHLGDVVVCPDVAARQAPDHAGSYRAEMTLLVVHGVLHVLGHDHAEPAEAAEMQERERVHLARYGLDRPVEAAP